jgi:hypothetical protein
MCYCIPTSIEISIDAERDGPAITSDDLKVSFGYAYVLYDDKHIDNPKPVPDVLMGIEGKIISKQVQCDRPCTYITVSVGPRRHITWRSVRICGQAISFV